MDYTDLAGDTAVLLSDGSTAYPRYVSSGQEGWLIPVLVEDADEFGRAWELDGTCLDCSEPNIVGLA